MVFSRRSAIALAGSLSALLFLIHGGPCHEDVRYDLSLLSPLRLLTFALHYCGSSTGRARFQTLTSLFPALTQTDALPNLNILPPSDSFPLG
ncbi:hypothetical protein BDR03DRAFT_976494, partial [Suillus americanus]